MVLSRSLPPTAILSIFVNFLLVVSSSSWSSSSASASVMVTTAFQVHRIPSSCQRHHQHPPHYHGYRLQNLHRQHDYHVEVEGSLNSSNADRRTALGKILATIASTMSSMSASAAEVSNKSLSEEYRQGTAALGNSDTDESIPRSSYITLPSGVIYADISNGSGNESVKEGSTVNLQWVLRRSNGYFVDSSAVSDSVPFIFKVGSGNAIAGLDEGVRGMKVGGSRRILIPPKLAYVQGVEDGKPGPLPVGFGPKRQITRVMEVRRDVPGEYFYLEVKVTKVR